MSHEKMYGICENMCEVETLPKSNLTNVFGNIADMKASNILEVNNSVKTLGYYTSNDGGEAYYIIRVKTQDDTEDNGNIHFISNNLVAELIIENNSVNVKQFGAKGDGTTDDTNCFKNAFGNVNIKNIIVPDGTYMIQDGQLSLNNGQTLEGVSKSNSIIKTIYSEATIASGVQSPAINIDGKNNCIVKNLTLEGFLSQKVTNDVTLTDKRHGIFIYNSTYVNIINVVCNNFEGDGILEGKSNNVNIKYVESTNNCRNGFAVMSGSDIILENLVATGTKGKDPECGFLFEPNNDTESLIRVRCKNLRSEDNKMAGLQFYLGFTETNAKIDVKIDGYYGKNNHYTNSDSLNCRGDLQFRAFKNTHNSDNLIKIKNVYIENPNIKAGISFDNKVYDSTEVSIENIKFKNINVGKQFIRIECNATYEYVDELKYYGGIEIKNVVNDDYFVESTDLYKIMLRVDSNFAGKISGFKNITLNDFKYSTKQGSNAYAYFSNQGNLSLDFSNINFAMAGTFILPVTQQSLALPFTKIQDSYMYEGVKAGCGLTVNANNFIDNMKYTVECRNNPKPITLIFPADSNVYVNGELNTNITTLYALNKCKFTILRLSDIYYIQTKRGSVETTLAHNLGG